MRYRILIPLILLAGFSLIVAAQFSIPTLFGADGYLHIRMSEFLREHGPRYNFHWARFSFFADRFCDKDFLYHALLIPFTFGKDIFFNAKVSAALFAGLLYLVFFLSLRRYCAIRSVVAAALVAFLLSAPFVRALCEPRNMVMIIGLTLVFTDALIRNRHRLLFFIALVYTLSHVSGPYLILFVLLGEGVRYANERTWGWKNLLAVVLGVGTGMLLHPNFPHNFLYFYLNGIAVPIFSLKWGLELGAEFFPIDTRDLVLGYPVLFIALLLLLVLGSATANKIKTSTKIWMAIAGFFFVFSFFSRRYLIHCYPMALVSTAAFTSDWWESAPRWGPLRSRSAQAGALVVALSLAGLLGAHTYKEFETIRLSERVFNGHYEAVGKFMEQHVPAGEVVFHANWSDSQYFIGLNPKDDYFVTLDPVYMFYWDKEKYRLYREIAFGNNRDPYDILKNTFGVHYGYAGKNYFSGLVNQVKNDSRFQVMAENELGVVFKLVD